MKLRVAVSLDADLAQALREQTLGGKTNAPPQLRFSAEALIERTEIVAVAERVGVDRLIDRRQEMLDDIVGPLPRIDGALLVLDLVLNPKRSSLKVIKGAKVVRKR